MDPNLIKEEDELNYEESPSQDDRMSVEDDPGDDEEYKNQSSAVDPEGEIIYDANAARPNYKLFTLRPNSCLNYHQMIDLGGGKKP